MKITVEVHQGDIRVLSVFYHLMTDSAIVLEVDSNCKFPELGTMSLTWFSLVKGRDTLFSDKKSESPADPTIISIVGLPKGKGWQSEMATTRYGARIFLWRGPLEFDNQLDTCLYAAESSE